MAGTNSNERKMRSSASKAADRILGETAVPGRPTTEPHTKGAAWRLFVSAALGVLSILCLVAVGVSLLAPRQKTAIPHVAPAAGISVWKPIAERVEQAQQGQFATSEGILTFSKTLDAADGEIRSVVGTYSLPAYEAAQLESGESWGVTGVNHDEFVMYVHNFLDVPVTAMIVRISDGTCASFTPQTPARWASAYWADALAAGRQAVFHATLPESYNLPSYCAVIYRIYASRHS